MNSLVSNLNGNNSTGKNIPFQVRFRYVFLGIVVACGGFLMISMNSHVEVLLLNPWPSQASHHYHVHTHEPRFTIRTEGCSITYMKPLDDSIQQFVSYPNETKPCWSFNYTLLDSNLTHIWVVRENLTHYNVSTSNSSKDVPHFTCCYNAFFRSKTVNDINSHWVDDRVEYKPNCINFSDYIEISDEFVKVNCTYKRKQIYEQFFLSALEINSPVRNSTEYNVIVMGVDAVSRMNFYRTMPRTVAFLKSKGAIDLSGYNKVGDNTFPNLMPMLLGIPDTDINITCLPTSDSNFDGCPFVWKFYKQAGFATALGEDSSSLGTFNYCKIGFLQTPTDYYIHTFIEATQKNVGNNKDWNTELCMNDQWYYKVLLDYLENLTTVMSKSKLFAFMWEISMSHDNLNYPMHMDEPYLQFFQRLYNSHYLEKTILLLVSDHGIRWGDIRSTKQGRLEERLPFVFVLTPESFRKNYHEAYMNLKTNSQRLTTPYDVHETLMDLINVDDKLNNKKIAERKSEFYASNRGISLFLPIPTNRTCKSAAIADHWCTCHTSIPISNESAQAKLVANHLLTHLNSMLSGYRQCATLTLDNVTELTELKNNVTDTEDKKWREFLIVVHVLPSHAIFEATLRHEADKWSVAGTVSRLNQYGSQSKCVQDFHMKLYCYCLNIF